MKKVRLDNNGITNIVKNTLRKDGMFVSESKIDSVIKKYLSERDDMMLDDDLPMEDVYTFTEETKTTFSDMVAGLGDTIEDLGVIRTTEGDVLVDTDVYAEEYMEGIIDDLESIVERLEFLKRRGLE
jgi:hypothetical protein